MIEKPFAYLFGFGMFVFLGWIFLAPTADARLQRSCQPVHWVGNIFVSMAALFTGEPEPPPGPSKRDMLKDGPGSADTTPVDAVTKTRRTFDEATYSCRYTLWRLVYEEDYRAAVRKLQEEQAQSEAASREATAKTLRPAPAPISTPVKQPNGRAS